MSQPDDETREHGEPESPGNPLGSGADDSGMSEQSMAAGSGEPEASSPEEPETAESTAAVESVLQPEPESAVEPAPPPGPVMPAEPLVAAAPVGASWQSEPVAPVQPEYVAPPPVSEPVAPPPPEYVAPPAPEPVASPSPYAPPVDVPSPPPVARVDDSPTTQTAVPPTAAAAVVQPSQPWQQPGQPQQQPGQWQQPSQYPQQTPQYPPQQPYQQAYPQQPGYPPQGYPQQPGYPPAGYPQQPGYPPGYVAPGYYPQQGPTYATVALVAVAGLLLVVFGLVDMGGGVWLTTQGRQLADFIERTTINLFGTTIDRQAMRSLLSPLPGILIVFGVLEVIAAIGIFAHKGWGRWLGVLLSIIGLVVGIVSLSFALALAPGFSVPLIGSIVVLVGYAFILLALFAGGRHFSRRYPPQG